MYLTPKCNLVNRDFCTHIFSYIYILHVCVKSFCPSLDIVISLLILIVNSTYKKLHNGHIRDVETH